ncbi:MULTISPECIES: hypothetical protein [Ensifer]|uniref:Uncharacterized protein n=1 Tax=Ensifer adhaerens TaxID=106592 RepID=A0A9Q8YF66_ENSAD|nr:MULTISPECIES: hypothetical protein [Ensifer]OWZ88978.1 hypothetical protein B9J07_35370 [Sinorhizobium sp. LM21]MBD9524886.1 hypothetical protein [Ensifer sp. ENS02]MBD9561169.1 hypothetical protein [Ensifer sp. ENS03]USJ27797.1 hypothetical protein NE863_28330 [Ensifer adhaerens]UTV40855.1 hypothetical protein MYG64_34395 [Ensifer adhaerens]
MSNDNGTDDRNSQPTAPGTTFGRSLESQAQMADARVVATGEAVETLNVYRLVPIAEANDPRWANAPPHGVVVVAARTAGDARVVAAGGELDFMEVDAAPAEDVTTLQASAFRSEKLYSVVEIERGRSDLRRGVLSGAISVGNIRPTQE